MKYCLALLLGLASCGGGGEDPAAQAPAGSQNLRPSGSPDVVVMSVAGHEGVLSAILCTSGNNTSYLGQPGKAVEALTVVLSNLGLTWETYDFADRLAAPDDNSDGVPDDFARLGFIELLETMEFVWSNWMDGFDNPTRIVIVAHSHGSNWAHIATSIMDHIPVEYLITLDGVCFGWECEHSSAVAAWVQQGGFQLSWDISLPCDRWAIPGQAGLFNTKDVVFDSVTFNLEVQSNSIAPVPFDCCDNYRTDGSRTGLDLFRASEGHTEVDEADSASMAWVLDSIVSRETAP